MVTPVMYCTLSRVGQSKVRLRIEVLAPPVCLVASRYPEGQPQATVLAMTDDKLDTKAYSLAEVAEMVLPPDITNGVRWLAHRLNRSEQSGYRVGRTWRMTHADVEDLIEQHRSRPLSRVDVPAPRTDSRAGFDSDVAPTAGAPRLVIDGESSSPYSPLMMLPLADRRSRKFLMRC
jgi:hypothetical protein